jgi:hypothetical protein
MLQQGTYFLEVIACPELPYGNSYYPRETLCFDIVTTCFHHEWLPSQLEQSFSFVDLTASQFRALSLEARMWFARFDYVTMMQAHCPSHHLQFCLSRMTRESVSNHR